MIRVLYREREFNFNLKRGNTMATPYKHSYMIADEKNKRMLKNILTLKIKEAMSAVGYEIVNFGELCINADKSDPLMDNFLIGFRVQDLQYNDNEEHLKKG